MNLDPAAAVQALNQRFFLDYPAEAAQRLESLPAGDAAALLSRHPLHVVLTVWPFVAGDLAEGLLLNMPGPMQQGVLGELEPALSANLLYRIDPKRREPLLAQLSPPLQQELRRLMQYGPDRAGGLMDPRVPVFRPATSIVDAESRLRASGVRAGQDLFLVDDHNRLHGRVDIQEFAVADPAQPLSALARPLLAAVQDVASREEVVELIEQHKLASLPVVDFSGRIVGVIHYQGLVTALAQETSLDIQTMVGASRDERALSPVHFAVRKRLGWLHINLVTAFVAAAVVGLFEGTIARFTALAVLLPVVAGQSGNAGAQALAVTMRGLALREIGSRHQLRVVWKEINVGLFNGVAIAATTGLGVYIWSRSAGLALVIGSSMVLSMIAAGFAGAIIPITLSRLGQDPAQSSSIILTTVTDVVGFFSFLGIATLLSTLL